MKALNFPTEMYFGEEAYFDLQQLQNERVMVITSNRGLERAERLRLTIEEGNNLLECFNEVLPDPLESTIKRGAQAIRNFEPTVIIALGGGSAMDAAKDMKVQAGFTGTLIAVPTTSGTGSEINDLAVVTEDETSVKIPKLDDAFQPEKAYLIPELATSMPKATTANTGMDALSHALEAYVAQAMDPLFRGYNDITDGMAEKAIQLLFEYLPKAYHNPEDVDARSHVMNAASLGGLAFIKAGLGAIHGISHSVGARLHLAHGLVNTLLMNDVIAYNAGLGSYEAEGQEIIAARYAKLAGMLDHKEYEAKEGTLRLMELIQELKETLDMPSHFTDTKVTEDEFVNSIDMMSTSAMEDPCMLTNPRALTKDSVVSILNNLK